jgi:diaminopimelate decarboxylase
MHFFNYKKNELFAEDVPLKKLAEKYGTPLYVYSHATLLRHFKAYDEALDEYPYIPHIICFAVKANSNLSILKTLGQYGGGADIVSGGELFKALKAGIPSKKIVYAGVGKTDKEIKFALASRILMFNVESESELKRIDQIAGQMKIKAPIALRVNPDVDPETHPYISTGLKKNKFGIPIEEALEHYKTALTLNNVSVIGVHKHIGSQITKISPFVDALKRVIILIDKLALNGIKIKYLDIGGGLGIPYSNEKPPLPKDLAKKLLPLLKGKNLTLIIEPGRSIIGNAGVLLTKVLYLKQGFEKEFIVVDAGMNDLIRPSLYNAYHQILPVVKTKRTMTFVDVVGPICETGDFLGKDRELQRVSEGEYLAVMSAGAYGFSMSSNYNSRPRPAEVMVKGNKHYLIRERETYHTLIAEEKISKLLK